MSLDLQDPLVAVGDIIEEDDMSAPTWTARYFTACANCSTKISPNDECIWVGNTPAHAACPDLEIDLTPRNPICSVCFLELPATLVCGNCV